MNMKDNPLRIIYLLGIKHSGKSSVGSYAATVMDDSSTTTFIDTDDLVMSHMDGRFPSIREFYRTQGAEAFKELEVSSLRSYLDSLTTTAPGLYIIATGGGACDNHPLVELMRATGILFYLEVSERTLFDRIMEKGLPPFLSADEPETSFHDLYVHRDGRYRQISDYMVRLSDWQSVPENGKLLASFILEVIGGENACREIPLERH